MREVPGKLEEVARPEQDRAIGELDLDLSGHDEDDLGSAMVDPAVHAEIAPGEEQEGLDTTGSLAQRFEVRLGVSILGDRPLMSPDDVDHRLVGGLSEKG
ncbi:hypothetical protein RMR04_00660 (plasmid) [Bosea sp. 685]|nr:hypothetical protein [Bosea sp. 685]WNJ87898.1 hypothetical protein RMR04_00660 [Bosea sp. 685]